MTRDDDFAHGLGRLLGPEGAQVGCEECFELLDCYVELVLAGADVAGLMPGVGEHLDDCLGCLEGYEGLLALIAARSEILR